MTPSDASSGDRALLSCSGASRTHSPAHARSRPVRRVVMLAMGLLVAAGGESATDHATCYEGFLRIVTPDSLSVTTDQCVAVGRQAMAAWRFDAELMRWANPATMETPLTMRVVSIEQIRTERSGVVGFAHGPDLFVVSAAALADTFVDGTLAHELAHIQAKRALGSVSEKHLVPRYFLEGHGNAMGRLYRDHLRITNREYDAHKARLVAGMNADTARTILTDNSYGAADRSDMDRMEAMGIFFVEYLRVRLGGYGFPDALTRMGRVFESVGQGKSYDRAFKQQFGAPVDEVVSQIVAFFVRTAARPGERWRGTPYEAFLWAARPSDGVLANDGSGSRVRRAPRKGRP